MDFGKTFKVADFMSPRLVQVTPDTTVRRCAELLAENRVGSAVVNENNALAGIVTEEDFTKKVVAKGLDPNKVLARDIMTKEVLSIDPDSTVYAAILELNSKRVKHLPVISGKKVMGMISAQDLLRVLPSYIDTIKLQP